MNRRQFLTNTTCLAVVSSGMPRGSQAAEDQTIYVNPKTGADSNPGTKGRPVRTLSAAAARINRATGCPENHRTG